MNVIRAVLLYIGAICFADMITSYISNKFHKYLIGISISVIVIWFINVYLLTV